MTFFTDKETDEAGIDIDNFDKETEIAKFRGLTPVGWTMFVRLYIRPSVTEGGIFLTSSFQHEEVYKSCTGLVVSIAPHAYKDERYKTTGKWIEVGDWVVFPRHAGFRIYWDGLPVWSVPEDAPAGIVDDPRRVIRG